MLLPHSVSGLIVDLVRLATTTGSTQHLRRNNDEASRYQRHLLERQCQGRPQAGRLHAQGQESLLAQDAGQRDHTRRLWQGSSEECAVRGEVVG